LKPAWENGLRDPISKITNIKRADRVAQGVGLEFKSQNFRVKKKKKKERKKERNWPSASCLTTIIIATQEAEIERIEV
jgi:hypothetical protein